MNFGRNNWSQITETIRNGTRRCSRNVGYLDFLWISEGGCQDFPSFLFHLMVPKVLLKKTFSASEKIRYRKTLRIRGGEYHVFPSNKFVLPYRKRIVWDLLGVSEKFRFREKMKVKKKKREGCELSLFLVEIVLSHGA